MASAFWRRERLAPAASWLLALGILALLFWRADRGALTAALVAADLWRYGALALLFVVIWLAIDAFVLSWLFSQLGAPIAWREMLSLRATTYLFIVISFHLANAVLVGLVKGRTGVSLARASASMLVLYAGDLTALAGVSFFASLGVDSPILSAIRPVLGLLTLGLVVLFGIGLGLRSRLAGRPFFGVIAELGALDIARLVALRTVFYTSFVVFVWLSLPAFGIELPLQAIASRMPVIMSIGALPITPGGLGTTQAAMLALFGELADPARVLAYAVVYGATLILFRLPLGAAFAPAVLGGFAARWEHRE